MPSPISLNPFVVEAATQQSLLESLQEFDALGRAVGTPPLSYGEGPLEPTLPATCYASHAAATILICSICGRQFERDDAYKRHMKSH
ncbi:hypothetical protein DAEQUDRAFT_764383 [Daedalea quercina L-15889]|uniref:C2H2-type domain-containing protein n=1 Tax=Daedalea quercina L-15889 TaxID=1314783 RepID=A0A165RJ11_9APHY|nr:hypothetical protein DAEQUDRAFT_764383 [Daedalea quercina L-15889]